MILRDNFNHNYIIERFKKGEISIAEAFNQLTNTEYNTDSDYSYSVHKINKEIDLCTNTKSGRSINRSKELYNTTENEETEEENIEYYLTEMDKLVGLENIKRLIQEYISFIKIQKIREKYNLKTMPVVMH
ncbi:MAG: hypothetical protein ACLFUI_04970, partial [Halanaerobiales bacterium]